jgi:RHS repeat-associated protein
MIQPKIIYTKCNQNTPLPAFSVTDYDDLGRIEAVFEYCTSETIDLENAKDPHELAGFLDDPNSIKREYFRTFYDKSPFLPQASDFWPENLQNRVACQAYYEEDPNPNSFDEPDAAYHYSYDIHGNVKTLLQQDTDMADYEWGEIITEYEYEIGSGNVLLVKYQEGKNDRMYHKYFYDADNRIIEVQTSNTQANKGLRTEAEYFYYPHGPLARVELGDKNRKVQGMDYIYTINGWIKAVNASTIDTTRDAGKDGKRKLPLGGVNPHRSIAADAFAYSLHYFENDYTPAVPNQGLIISFNGSGLQEAIKGSGLYNGNITAQVIALRKPEDNSPKIPLAGYAYQYDRLNRLKHMNSSVDFNGEADSGNSWNNIAINSYRSNYSYDANGNITRLDRFDIDSVLIDSLLYHYNTNNNGRIINNRLDYITQSVSTNPNLSDQNSNNYEYDEIGNLISDAIHEISNIEWNSFGKVKMVEFNSKLPLWFRYDSYGRRVMKYDQSLDRATFYTYDASGNVMGIYERKFDGQHDALYISQLPMYGSSRLGVINSNTKLSYIENNIIKVCDNLHDDDDLNIKYVYCNRQYELTNHLGNVMTTISDDRMGVADNSSFPSTVLYYLPKILTTTDYYPFGMQMPDRSYVATGTGYRFGFNGKENITEIIGWQDYGERLYNVVTGRPPNVDPITKEFPELSPYQFFSNNPIWFIDLNGLQGIPAQEKPDGTWTTAVDASWVQKQTIKPLPAYTSIGGSLIAIPEERGQISIAQPTPLRDFENWLDSPSSNFSEGISKVGLNIGYSFLNSPKKLFTGYSLAGTKQTPSQKMDAFVDFVPGLILGGITKSSQVMKTTNNGIDGFNDFIKKGGKEITYPGISKDLPTGMTWQKRAGNLYQQNKISQEGIKKGNIGLDIMQTGGQIEKEIKK